jgi:hypothetical protein
MLFETGREITRNKVVPVHAMKMYRGRRVIALFILNLGTRWM